MTTMVGYARVSTGMQSLDVQRAALEEAGCGKIFAEKRSGGSTADRVELKNAFDWLREGDTLVVTRLDRLARSAVDLHSLIAKLAEKGVGFRCLQQGAIDTTSSTGKLLLGVLASIAEFETDIRTERQREGIENAKLRGVYTGRKPSIDVNAVCELRDQGIGPTAIAQQLKIGRVSVYRVLSERSTASAP